MMACNYNSVALFFFSLASRAEHLTLGQIQCLNHCSVMIKKNVLLRMYSLHLILILLLRALPTSSLAMDTTTPSSLSQDQNTAPNTTLPFRLQPYNLTETYNAECARVTSPQLPELNPSRCLDAIPIICFELTQTPPSHVQRQRWIWVETPGCALAYYVPVTSGGVLPSPEECETDIYGLIIERCAFRPQYNVGSINVAQLPKNDDPGLPITEEYLRYLMAPGRL